MKHSTRIGAATSILAGLVPISGCNPDGSATTEEIVFWVVIGVSYFANLMLALHVAKEKHRSSDEATTLSLIFGPFGTLILALLPTKPAPPPPPDPKRNASNPAAEVVLNDMDSGGAFPFVCPACSRSIRALPSAIDSEKTCPGCGQSILLRISPSKPLPKPNEVFIHSGPRNGQYKAECRLCRSTFSVPVLKMGKKAKCPACREEILLPSEEDVRVN